MTVECPDCGNQHRTINTLPDQPLHLENLLTILEEDSILYAGPTLISSEKRTPMISIVIEGRASIASYYDDLGWLVTYEVEDDVDGEFGELLNEAASQCIENGYRCFTSWMDDGEPGGQVPQLHDE